jgi:hypothetical protein
MAAGSTGHLPGIVDAVPYAFGEVGQRTQIRHVTVAVEKSMTDQKTVGKRIALAWCFSSRYGQHLLGLISWRKLSSMFDCGNHLSRLGDCNC